MATGSLHIQYSSASTSEDTGVSFARLWHRRLFNEPIFAMYLLRAMGALRAGRSVVARPAMRYSQARSAGLGYAQTHAANTFSRYFAAEAGFLDKGEVHDRVMEVVRKFEKV